MRQDVYKLEKIPPHPPVCTSTRTRGVWLLHVCLWSGCCCGLCRQHRYAHEPLAPEAVKVLCGFFAPKHEALRKLLGP